MSRLERNIDATQREMKATRVIQECADCAVNGEGTCCGRRTGHKCNIILLFINLMMGKSLPTVPDNTHLCHFLTKQGCGLRARHVICINFVCHRIKDFIPHKDLCRLQDIAGEEMDSLFVLEEYIKKKIGFDALRRCQESPKIALE